MLGKKNKSILILSIILGIFLLGLVSSCESYCGDGNLDVSEGEECDDGNSDDYDLCSNDCQIQYCDFEFTKTDSVDPVSPGDDLSYDITLTNIGTAKCTGGGVQVKEYYDEYTSFVESVPAPISGNNLWNFGTIMPGVTKEINIDTEVSESTPCDETLVNEVCVWALEIDEWRCIEETTEIYCETPEPYCGDGNVDDGEECDDGNDDNFDECRNDCTLPYCGDGIIDPSEECEEDSDCPADCNPNTTDTCVNCMCVYVPEPYCGDGNLDLGEECDDGINNGEVCVPEYGDSCQYCGNTCELVVLEGPYCGDCECNNGYETCETCPQDCGECPPEPPVCGNGILESSEECDLGELLNGQVCEPPYDGSCTYCSEECEEITLYDGYCGDGIKDILYEECDDGNSINGDGCSASCTSEEDKDGNGRGGRKRSFKPQQFCDVNWECSGWSECFNGITTRRCQETNHCEIPYNKPIEQTGCEITAKALIEKNGVNWAFILFGIIIPLILIIILIILLRKK